MTCPACLRGHVGPRAAHDAHVEMSYVLGRASEMPTGDAASFMRINFLRMGFELSGFCPGCVLDAQTLLGGSPLGPFPAVRAAEEAMQAATEPDISNVIPIARARQERRATVFDLAAKHDSEVKHP